MTRRVLVDGDDDLARRLGDRGLEVTDEDVDAVVHVLAIGTDERPVGDDWDERCDDPLVRALDAAQDAYRRLAGRGGWLVFVVPSFGLTGAAGLVPEATAAEGVRSLAKSAARQWGADGITVGCVARHVAGPEVALASLDPPTADDVADAVALLLDDRARAVTGTTLVVDAGTVLVP